MTNFNMWYVLIPAFLVEALIIGCVTCNLKASRLSDLATSAIAVINAAIVAVSVWHDSQLGIIQLAEDMTVGYEDPALALFFILCGGLFLAGVYAFAQIWLIGVGTTLPEKFRGDVLPRLSLIERKLRATFDRVLHAPSRFWSQHFYRTIQAQDVVASLKASDFQVEQYSCGTVVTVHVSARPAWSWTKRHS